MSFVGTFKFIVAETQRNRPAYPFSEERSLAHFAAVVRFSAGMSVELNRRRATIRLK